MEYIKIELESKKKVYALREYFPYTDKPFFKSLDDILTDDSLQSNLANLFVQLYKDELVFLYKNIDKHTYIYPIKHVSRKFTKINNIIASELAKTLGIELIDDYFSSYEIPFVDIRDEYTKDNNVKVEVNDKYKGIPIIIFDCCVSTGIIFNSISSLLENDLNLYLAYGVRYNSINLNKSHTISIEDYEFNPEKYMVTEPGYFVRIYGLFGSKDVEVDFRNPFSICIGENGYGKTTAVKLALYALKEYSNKDIKKDKLSILANYYFDKIEIYYSDWFISNNYNKESMNNPAIAIGDRVFNKELGKGTVIGEQDGILEVLFDDKSYGTRKIDKKLLSVVDEKENIIPNQYIVSFKDKEDNCFYQQIVPENGLINIKELKKYKIYDLIEKQAILDRKEIGYNVLYRPILEDIDIKLRDFKFNYDYLKSVGDYSTSLAHIIHYDDVIPSKVSLCETLKVNEINSFLNSINNDEYVKLIRKIILDDRSIEIDYSEIDYKYKISFNYKNIDKIIRQYLDSIKSIENNDYIEYNSDAIYLSQLNAVFFNCTKTRRIISPPPRDRIQLDHYEINYNYDYSDLFRKNIDELLHQDYEFDQDGWNEYIEEKARQREEDEIDSYKATELSPFSYDDPEEYNQYEDDFGNDYDDMGDYIEEDDIGEDYDDFASDGLSSNYNEYDYNDDSHLKGNSIFKNFTDSFIKGIDKLFEFPHDCKCYHISRCNESEEKNLFDNENIYIHYILHDMFLDNDFDDEQSQIEVTTNLYNILQKIKKINDTKIINNYLNLNNDSCVKVDEVLSDKDKNEIKKIYDTIFSTEYDIISLGIYDILSNDEFENLSAIIKRLRSKGIQTDNDYFIVIGLKMMINSYKCDFINEKSFLLEKLLNKYLINKHSRVYANSLAILDNNDNYIPIDKLSTGERNLIILFSFCLYNKDKLVILDEPDLSMSVDWQAKILVDLLKYTRNKYMVISQSPLLIQKNNLSTFVKRLDFESLDNLVDHVRLIQIIEMANSLPF